MLFFLLLIFKIDDLHKLANDSIQTNFKTFII